MKNQLKIIKINYSCIILQNISDCEATYGSYPRGQNCYCTPFVGCFHRHYQIKPDIKVDGGLITGKDRGVHDSDYYIEVSVLNKAKLNTVLIKKVCLTVLPIFMLSSDNSC